MPKGPPPSEQRIVLEKVSWQKYETLLAEMQQARTSRFTYDRGRLEMMSPLDEHERCHKLIESLILVLADEVGFPLEVYKSPTLLRPDLRIGTEPDTAYYVQHQPEVKGKHSLDLMADPPPDLVLEVALNKSSLDKMPIYESLGIPEVWRYISKVGDDFFKGDLQIYCWTGDRYFGSNHSLAFPFLPTTRVLQFIEQSDTLGLASGLRLLRDWLQEIHPN
jgi:Uma2 family endonuclease